MRGKKGTVMPSPVRPIPTNFTPDSRVGKLWEDIKNHHADETDRKLVRLERSVNHGFIAEPFTSNQFINDTTLIEAQEVFEHAYSHWACRKFLAKHGFPVHFAMDDFNPKLWTDDQIRFQTSHGIRDVSRKFKNAHPAWSAGSKEFCGGLAKKLDEWAASAFRFNSHCESEYPDWMAVFEKCGKCTEKTDIAHYVYETAGLRPEFLIINGQRPARNWIEAAENNNPISGHVLIEIPHCSGRDIQIDWDGKLFDANLPGAMEVSPRNYELSVINNAAAYYSINGQVGKLLETIDLARTIAPENFEWAFKEFMIKSSFGGDNVAQRTGINQLLDEFPDHPAAKFLHKYITASIETGSHPIEQLKTEGNELNTLLKDMERDHPKIAAQVHLILADKIALDLDNDAGKMSPDVLKQSAPSMLDVVAAGARQYFAVLSLEPNANSAFQSLYLYVKKWVVIIPALAPVLIEECENALEKNPDHVPLHYLAAMSAISPAGGEKVPLEQKLFLSIKAIAHLRKITELEPSNPIVFTDIGHAYLGMGELDGAEREYDRAKDVSKGTPPLDYYAGMLRLDLQQLDPGAFGIHLNQMLDAWPSQGTGIVKEFFSNFNWFINLEFKSAEDFQSKVGLLSQKLRTLLDGALVTLKPFPIAAAQASNSRATLAVLVAIAEGEEEWKKWMVTIPNFQDREVVKALKWGIAPLIKWLSSSLLDEAVADVVSEKVGILERDLPPELDDELLKVSIELVRNYIMTGNTRKAEEIWSRMFESDSAMAINLFTERVMNRGIFTLGQHLKALEMLCKYRKRLAPELRRQIKTVYERLLPHIKSDPALSPKAPEIRKRIKEL